MAEITGTVTNILPVEQIKDKQKQTFAIKTDGQYPKTVAFEVWNDKIQYIKSIGSVVTVSYDVESREYGGKYYTQLKAFAIK